MLEKEGSGQANLTASNIFLKGLGLVKFIV